MDSNGITFILNMIISKAYILLRKKKENIQKRLFWYTLVERNEDIEENVIQEGCKTYDSDHHPYSKNL